jgi:hypothetical protein
MAISTVDVLLTPLEPTRALRYVISEVDQLSALDPKLRQARAQIMDALAGAAAKSDDQETLGAVFWLQLRGQLTSRPAETVEAFRRWLGDGDLVLRTVDDVLRTALTTQVLQSLIDEAGRYDGTGPHGDTPTDPGPQPNRELEQARAELRRILHESPEDNPAVAGAVIVGIAFLAGVAGGYVIDKIIHHI